MPRSSAAVWSGLHIVLCAPAALNDPHHLPALWMVSRGSPASGSHYWGHSGDHSVLVMFTAIWPEVRETQTKTQKRHLLHCHWANIALALYVGDGQSGIQRTWIWQRMVLPVTKMWYSLDGISWWFWQCACRIGTSKKRTTGFAQSNLAKPDITYPRTGGEHFTICTVDTMYIQTVVQIVRKVLSLLFCRYSNSRLCYHLKPNLYHYLYSLSAFDIILLYYFIMCKYSSQLYNWYRKEYRA